MKNLFYNETNGSESSSEGNSTAIIAIGALAAGALVLGSTSKAKKQKDTSNGKDRSKDNDKGDRRQEGETGPSGGSGGGILPDPNAPLGPSPPADTSFVIDPQPNPEAEGDDTDQDVDLPPDPNSSTDEDPTGGRVPGGPDPKAPEPEGERQSDDEPSAVRGSVSSFTVGEQDASFDAALFHRASLSADAAQAQPQDFAPSQTEGLSPAQAKAVATVQVRTLDISRGGTNIKKSLPPRGRRRVSSSSSTRITSKSVKPDRRAGKTGSTRRSSPASNTRVTSKSVTPDRRKGKTGRRRMTSKPPTRRLNTRPPPRRPRPRRNPQKKTPMTSKPVSKPKSLGVRRKRIVRRTSPASSAGAKTLSGRRGGRRGR